MVYKFLKYESHNSGLGGGGPGNSLDLDRNYQIGKDLSNIVNDSINTNVGFVGLLQRHDKPHMSRWVRGVNMELERALWTADKSHVSLIDVVSINRYDHTRHGFSADGRVKDA
jgi:hypothetical protein